MAETDKVPPPGKFMVDPYLDWTKKEGIPVHEDFGFDLHKVRSRHGHASALWAASRISRAAAISSRCS